MNRLLLLPVCLALKATHSIGNAARLVVEPDGHSAAGAYAIFVAPEKFNGEFNTIIVEVTADEDSEFGNLSSTGVAADEFRPYRPGEAFTGYNALLACGGACESNWVLLGFELTPRKLEFTAGPLGSQIDLSSYSGGLFVANVYLPGPDAGATANILFVDAGEIVADLTASIGGVVPEPTSGVLTMLACSGVLSFRRNRDRIPDHSQGGVP